MFEGHPFLELEDTLGLGGLFLPSVGGLSLYYNKPWVRF
jgi:hypothetical protein